MSNFQGQLCWYDHPTPNAKKTTILAAAESVRTCTFFQHSCVEARAENWLKRFAGGNNCQARALQTTRAFWTVLIWHCIALGGKPRAKEFLVQKGAINIYLAVHAIFFWGAGREMKTNCTVFGLTVFIREEGRKGPKTWWKWFVLSEETGYARLESWRRKVFCVWRCPFFYSRSNQMHHAQTDSGVKLDTIKGSFFLLNTFRIIFGLNL